ncbi:MAG: phosphatase [Leptolyngbyaceae cyanobacterium SM2_3_12]|nr:phosphatase [Leptolyngbyaceae cyanobacterium SM2_3_12]
MLNSIRNYLPISPTLATAGQPTAEQFEAIRQAGYDLVINLAVPTSENALAHEPELVEQLGMAHVHIPVLWETPTLADLAQFFAVMDANAQRQIFVHCALNMRVSAFVYLYRVLKQNVPPSVAQADLDRIWQPNPTWQAFIDQALAQ